MKDLKAMEWVNNDSLSYQIWNNKYRFNGESFDQWIDRISNGVEGLRELILEKKFMYGGRILANLNTGTKQGISNCVTAGYVEDSLDAIMDMAKELALSYKREAGVGVCLSKIRPKGAKIGEKGVSDGIIGFLKIFNEVTANVSRGNQRRGAMLVGLHCDHPDVLDFIKIKKDNKGSNGLITSANISVLITDEFMEHYKKRESYRKDFVVKSTGEIIPHIVDTVKIMEVIADTPKTSFEPGILFVDRYQENHLFGYAEGGNEMFNNACHTYDSLLLTDRGYFKIGELSEKNEMVNAWNGFEFSEVLPVKTSDSEDIYLVKFSDGSENKVTGYHKFHVNNTIKRTTELNIGDEVDKFSMPLIDVDSKFTFEDMYTQGMFAGDGTITYDRGNKDKPRAKITLCGVKVDLLDKLVTISDTYTKNEKGYIQVGVKIPFIDKTFVPTNYSIKEKIGFISGLLDSDGNSNTSARISSIDKDFLNNVKLMLSTLGVKCTLRLESETEYRAFNGKEYKCNPIYTLTIPKVYSQKLIDLGLDCGRIELQHPISKREISPIVISVEKLDKKEAVYCANEPKNHTLVVNGMYSGNCSEFIGQKATVCLLGSLNLSEFVKDGMFNFTAFAKAVKIGITALDKAHDYGIGRNGLDAQNERAENHRGIGLGVMGVADMFMKMEMKYGSMESVELSKQIASLMKEIAIETSKELAEKYGQPSGIVKDEEYLIKNNLPVIKGLRNNSLLSIAPSGSISALLGISSGIEPVFRTAYTRRTESLDETEAFYEVVHKPIQDIINKLGYKPDYCIDTRDVSAREKIDVISAWQKYVDLSISNTTNFAKDTKIEEIRDLYVYGWEKKVKGLTVYVDGSIDGVLNDTDSKEEMDMNDNDLKRGDIMPVPDDLIGKRITINHGCGKYSLHAYKCASTGKVFDCFINSKSDGCISNVQAIAVCISLLLRAGVKLDRVQKALNGMGSCPSFMVGKVQGRCSDGKSCSTAIIKALIDFENEEILFAKKVKVKQEKEKINNPTCPDCGTELAMESGCRSCQSCGWSKCS